MTRASRKDKPRTPDCRACGAACCRYVALEIDKPTCKRDYDNIRWYLLHENIHVYIDYDGSWYLEVDAKCTNLADDNHCIDYENRPRICRDHGEGDEECVYVAELPPHTHRFSTPRQFESYLSKRGIDWKWKKR